MNTLVNDFHTLLGNSTYFLLIFIGVYFIAGTIDFLLGTFIASLDKEKDFSSRMAQLGIVRKLATMFIMVLVIPVALTLPFEVGFYSLTVLYVGIVTSEIYSVLGHIGIVKDGDKGKQAVAKILSDLLDNALKNKKG